VLRRSMTFEDSEPRTAAMLWSGPGQTEGFCIVSSTPLRMCVVKSVRVNFSWYRKDHVSSEWILPVQGKSLREPMARVSTMATL
jgi:hypothetical protein